MQVVEWSRPSRHFPQEEVDDFYHRPLDAPTVFRFETSRTALPTHSGAFSLKSVISGEEEYKIGKRTIVLRPGDFLFVNAGECYSSEIVQKTKSISIFAPQIDARETQAIAQQPSVNPLEPSAAHDADPEITQIPFRVSTETLKVFAGLNDAIDGGDLSVIRDHTRLMISRALIDLFRASPPIPLPELKKRSTRDELRDRILRAKTLMDDTDGSFCDLDSLAAEACLSKYHFLRIFNEIYGMPPATYARRLRFHAAHKSFSTNGDIIQAAKKAGFRDVRAFRRAYANFFQTSIPPAR